MQVDVEKSAKSNGLVVGEVGTAEVAVEVGGQQVRVVRRAEARQGHAVGRARAADLAGQQEVSQAPAELRSAGDGDEPSDGPAFTPAVFEEYAELVRGDGSGVVGERARQPVVRRLLQPQQAPAKFHVAPLGRDMATYQFPQLSIFVGLAHHMIVAHWSATGRVVFRYPT
ncbi:hypothetical protein IPZ68_21980 [Streptomyces arenae]|nr:hypothetical protein [Streptomyces arenae]